VSFGVLHLAPGLADHEDLVEGDPVPGLGLATLVEVDQDRLVLLDLALTAGFLDDGVHGCSFSRDLGAGGAGFEPGPRRWPQV